MQIDSTNCTEFIAVDDRQGFAVYGTDGTESDCLFEAGEWTGQGIDGLTVYRATEAARAYASRAGADAGYEMFRTEGRQLYLADHGLVPAQG